MSSATLAEVTGGIDGAGVVGTGGLVVLCDLASALCLVALLEAIASGSSGGAVLNHLLDHAGWARVDADAGSGAVVALHQASVLHAVVGGLDADAALALLHDDCQDEALVDAAGAGDRFNVFVDLVRFRVAVVAG